MLSANGEEEGSENDFKDTESNGENLASLAKKISELKMSGEATEATKPKKIDDLDLDLDDDLDIDDLDTNDVLLDDDDDDDVELSD